MPLKVILFIKLDHFWDCFSKDLYVLASKCEIKSVIAYGVI